MTISYTQTDTNSGITAQAACSGQTVGATTRSKTAAVGGPAGSTAVACGGGLFDSGLVRALAFFEIVPDSGVTWGAGDWTVRLNITAAGNCTWNATYICRLNSSNVSQATIGSLTGQTTSINSTGVKTHTVSGASQTPSAGDKVYLVLVFTAGANNIQFSFTPNQDIDAPFTPALQTATPLVATVALSGIGAAAQPGLQTATALAAAIAVSAADPSASVPYVAPPHSINNFMRGRSSGLHHNYRTPVGRFI